VHKLDPMDLAPPESGKAARPARAEGSGDARVGVGTIVADRFELLELLGVGGMGSVYRARDVTLDETVALKMIARSIAREPGMLERFRREVRLARRVTHPNVARCFDIGQDHDDCFFTMELIEGESLRARLDREGRVTAAVAIAIATEVCAGLGAAHRAGVVHRDLKPDNVMLGADGRVVLTDFGIASARQLADRGQRTVGTLVGTPEYISPEQVQGERDLDGRADIYSLGVMLFELLTGRAAWTGPTPLAVVVARLGVDPPDPRNFIELDAALAAIVMRCMARRREDRFASVDDVARALYAVYSPGAGEQLGRSFSRPPGPGARHDPGLVKLSLGALGQANSVLVLACSDDDDELSMSVADGLGELVERQLRSATSVHVAAKEPARNAPGRRALRGMPVTIAAKGTNAPLTVEVKVAIVGRSVSADVALVDAADGAVLWSTQLTGARAGLFDVAARIARDVAVHLSATHRQTLPPGITDVEPLDLWLRARYERTSGAPLALDRSVALFERAMGLVPEEPWLLASYAATLVDRFVETAGPSGDLVEAVGMAEKVLASTHLMSEGWLARGVARFELGDPSGALSDAARAARITPHLARVHALRGCLLRETNHATRARAHLDRAVELQPWSSEAHLDLALSAGLTGTWDEANARVARLADERSSTPEGWLLASRFALWSGDLRAARSLRSRLETALPARSEACLYVLDAALGEPASDAPDYFAWLAEIDPVAARRSALAREIEAELASASGDFARAMEAMDAAAGTAGYCDLAWLDGCPLLVPLRGTPRFAELRERVAVNARAVTEALESTREQP